jgi:dCMP deaminase
VPSPNPRRLTWDATWLTVADTIAKRSLCDGSIIGAAIVDINNRIVSTGYNGAPAGYENETEENCRNWCPRMKQGGIRTATYSNCISVHAEANAIAFADRRHYEGGTIYITRAACWDCAKLIANCGVGRVVQRVYPADSHRDPERSIAFMEECGLEVRAFRISLTGGP